MSDSPAGQGTPQVIDVAALTAPIAGGAPTGVELREDPDPNSPYRVLKAAREAARAAERQAVDEPGTSTADWSQVSDRAVELLTEKSKDLEICAWLLEALLRQHGFAGLRDGFRVVRELCESSWEGLHPVLTEDGGIPDRVFALTGLNGEDREGTLIAPLRMVALAHGPSGEPWGLWHYERAVEIEKIADPEAKAGRLSAPGAVALAAIETAVAGGNAGTYRTLAADLTGAREELTKLGAVMDRLCSFDAPPANFIRGVLERYDEALHTVASQHLAAAAVAAAAGSAAASGGGGGAGGGGVPSGPLRTREEAFLMLEAASEYFRRTEPHSPLSYSLQQCVRWGRMPLPDLLAELIADEGTRATVFRLTGIRPPAPPAT